MVPVLFHANTANTQIGCIPIFRTINGEILGLSLYWNSLGHVVIIIIIIIIIPKGPYTLLTKLQTVEKIVAVVTKSRSVYGRSLQFLQLRV